MNKKQTGILIAATVGALFVTASFAAEQGVNSNHAIAAPAQTFASNSCKGNSNGPNNSCKGKSKNKKKKKSNPAQSSN